MHTNGEAIYETTANPFPVEFEWGRVTKKGNDTLYLFVYQKPENGLIDLPCLYSDEPKAVVPGSIETIMITQNDGKTIIHTQNLKIGPGTTVIKLIGQRN